MFLLVRDALFVSSWYQYFFVVDNLHPEREFFGSWYEPNFFLLSLFVFLSFFLLSLVTPLLQVYYTFKPIFMLAEPLMLASVFFLFFVACVAYLHIDLSLHKWLQLSEVMLVQLFNVNLNFIGLLLKLLFVPLQLEWWITFKVVNILSQIRSI